MKSKLILAFGLIASFLLVSLPSLRADALDNWTRSLVSTNPFGFAGIWLIGATHGNGRYVAVGQYVEDDYGVVETSEDGMNWTMRSQRNGTIWDLWDVTFGNGMFVTVGWDWYGGANLYSSTNGINWTSYTTKISNFYGVTYGGGLFVAVGDGLILGGLSSKTNRNIYTSPDGITWTARNSGSPVNDVPTIKDVAYGANRFVAVDDAGHAYTSATGTTWARNAVGTYNYVNYCNGLFFSQNNTGTNLVSSDGSSWSVMVKDTTNVFSRVIYTNGLYAALSGTNVFTSTNGTNWIQRSLHAPTNVNLSEITFGDRNIVAVGYSYPPTYPYYPMVPVAYVSDSIIAVCMKSSFPPQLSISGLQGRYYRIECADTLPGAANNWWTNTTVQLPGSPYIWTDTTATSSQRFYRAVLLP
ncbi:MAG: hypothetical protein ABSH11_10385 [Verrucomicrobiota bacterium]|jgi:hypothetical protein